ncbi:LysR family transcriptional regulator [Amycolatopsis sp. CA-230715]|uniref:LysR family transcriptional regulator n=1 Tax=Amycolatopsis sp. CA-230715 TaxID=2745196 RepID=UPI001C02117B|nr:LysR family transcriptional regulator [Amycolatopsis sp. CA-230715]QWF83292.1 PCP degradation transcriptional activation protein [Amycolatopsis sp. CA-230715]
MKSVDLNLLVALDALLDEGSVTGAAERLRTSTPTMSRTLARLRRALGDPILVRAGRTMVPTPRAAAVRDQVRAVLEQAERVFVEGAGLDLAALRQTFTVEANELVMAMVAQPLLAAVRAQAPQVVLRFLAAPPENIPWLRDGAADLAVGVLGSLGAETSSELLLTDRMVGMVRSGHKLTRGRMTLKRFAAAQHLSLSRRGKLAGPVDDALAEHGLRRQVVCTVASWSAATRMVAHSDLVGLAPEKLGREALSQLGLRTFPVPVPLPAVALSQAWHVRYDADPAHAWLRRTLRDVVAKIAD